MLILWRTVALEWLEFCGIQQMGRLPMLVPVIVQLLAVSADMPFAVGSSLTSGVKVLTRLVVHPVSAMIALSSLSAWKGLSAGSALV